MKKNTQNPEQAPLSAKLKDEAAELLKKIKHHSYCTAGTKQLIESAKFKP